MDWKNFERHHLSAEYPDVKGKAREEAIANLKEHGINPPRKIVLYERKVLDGWQLYSWCLEADIQPEFEEFVPGPEQTVGQFLSTANDHRRHETQGKASKRAAARRERVAKAREDGKSLRMIAEEEGVSEASVRKDLENSGAHRCAPEGEASQEPGVPPGTPESNGQDSQKVTGRDGKKYSKNKPTVLCERCTRVGATKGCEACKSATALARKKSGEPIFDDRPIDKVIGQLTRYFDDRANALGKTSEFHDCMNCMANLVMSWQRWQLSTTKAKT